MQYAQSDAQLTAQQEDDKNLMVKFFIKPRKDNAASAAAGRDIYKDCEHIDMKAPGSRNGAARPATQGDKDRFPEHYARFKNRISNEDVIEGTLLSEWPLISRSLVEELAFFNVKTVEHLVAMSDGNASKFMGLTELRKKAKAWLDAAAENADVIELRTAMQEMESSNNELKSTIENMRGLISEMESRISEYESQIVTKRKAGRKKKTED